MVNDIWLGQTGSEILLPAFGRTLTIKRIDIDREDRTYSGRLVRDIRAQKKGFTIAYALIPHADLESISTLYELKTTLSLKVQTPTGLTSYTVHLRPFDSERVTAVGDSLWGNVNLELEQE